MSFITIYITHPDEACAAKISQALLDQRLVACANLFPIKSAYWWKGKIDSEEEWVSLVKTMPEQWDRINQLVATLHPYEVPCLMKTTVEANSAYEQWIQAQLVLS